MNLILLKRQLIPETSTRIFHNVPLNCQSVDLDFSKGVTHSLKSNTFVSIQNSCRVAWSCFGVYSSHTTRRSASRVVPGRRGSVLRCPSCGSIGRVRLPLVDIDRVSVARSRPKRNPC